MTGRQKIVVLVGVAVVALMLLYPPWHRVWGAGGVFSQPLGYAPLFSPPTDQANLDLTRLGVQCAVVAVLTFGLYVLVGHKKES